MRDAHLKVWAVLGIDDQVTAALVSSANLTRQGLVNNEEVCAEVSGADLVDIERRMIALRGEAWDCCERIVGYLEPDAPPVAPNPGSWAERRVLRPPSGGRSCFCLQKPLSRVRALRAALRPSDRPARRQLHAREGIMYICLAIRFTSLS